jgi:hypothetical protein
MTIELGSLPRHAAKNARKLCADLPAQGNWRIVKAKDHYFLYDGPTRVAFVANNASKERSHFIADNARKIKTYTDAHYARRVTTES